MKKKVIKNTILLLLIPICITLIVYFTHRTKNVFYDPINYSVKEQRRIDDVQRIRLNDDELNRLDGVFDAVNRNYSIIMFSACGLVLIFALIYSYVYRKKQW